MSQSASLWCSIARCTASTAALPGQPAAQLCKNALHLPPPHPASSHLLAVQRHHPALHHIPRLVTAQRRLHLRIRMSSRRRCCSCANAGGKRALCGCCGLRRRRRLLLVPCCFLFRDQRELQALAAGVGTQHPALDHCRQAGRQAGGAGAKRVGVVGKGVGAGGAGDNTTAGAARTHRLLAAQAAPAWGPLCTAACRRHPGSPLPALTLPSVEALPRLLARRQPTLGNMRQAWQGGGAQGQACGVSTAWHLWSRAGRRRTGGTGPLQQLGSTAVAARTPAVPGTCINNQLHLPVRPPKNCTNTPKSAVPVTTPCDRPPGTASCKTAAAERVLAVSSM